MTNVQGEIKFLRLTASLDAIETQFNESSGERDKKKKKKITASIKSGIDSDRGIFFFLEFAKPKS